MKNYLELTSKIKFDGTYLFNYSNCLFIPQNGGIYFISDYRGILYIGRSNNLQRRYSQHIYNEKNELLKCAYQNPLGNITFSWIIYDYPKQVKYERFYINKISPICNKL